MSCITVSHESLGGVWATSQSIGGVTAYGYPLGGITATGFPLFGISTSTTRRGGIRVRMWQECSTNIGRKNYLEIEPTVVWVLNGWTSNDVYSNTTWYVD